jgi:hypothetical protein
MASHVHGVSSSSDSGEYAMERPPFIPKPQNPFPIRRISTVMTLIATIGLEHRPVCRIIYRWWLVISN